MSVSSSAAPALGRDAFAPAFGRDCWALSLCGLIVSLVANGFRIEAAGLASASRQVAPIARARQMAMYLVHTGFGLSFATIARAFRRDAATVRHACARIETLRESGRFDGALRALEASARRRIAGVSSDCGRTFKRH